MSNPRITKGSIGFTYGNRPTEPSKPRRDQPALPAPGEAPPEAPQSDPDDKAELVTVRLYRRQRERLEALRTILAPGIKLSRSGVVRWLLDHWTK